MVTFRFGVLSGLLVVLFALVAVSGSAFRESDPVGFTFTNGDGEDTSLAEYEGQIVVLAFFVDCGPIGRAQALELETNIRPACDPGQVKLIGVAGNGSRPETVRDFVESAGISYPVLIDMQDTRSSRCPDNRGLLTMVFDEQMQLRHEAPGSADAGLIQVLHCLLATTKKDESTWGKIKELFK